MTRRVLLPVLLLLAGLTGCGTSSPPKPDPDAVVTAEDLRCDHDPAEETLKGVIERTGGRSGDGYTVVFAQSTKLGVVALIKGDVEKVGEQLIEDTGTALVAGWEGRNAERPDQFARVRELVEAYCD